MLRIIVPFSLRGIENRCALPLPWVNFAIKKPESSCFPEGVQKTMCQQEADTITG